jgi:arylsulfatase A-like enzyme
MLSEPTITRRSLPLLLTSTLQAAKKQPNVLILFADDMRADTLAAWGNRHILTPNLDKLVQRGLSFRRAYVQGSNQGAVCVASRAMLHTGKSLWRAMGPNGFASTTLAERFAEAGYRTFLTGKWHNGLPNLKRGWQQGGPMLMGGMGPQIDPALSEFGETKPTSTPGRATPLFTNSLITFLKKKAKTPFLAYVAFTAPHDPREAAAEDKKLYASRELPLPRPWAPAPQVDNGETIIRDEMVVPAPRNEAKCQDELKNYYALITELDRSIGRILKTLEDTQQLDNTLIVFAADNGLAMGAHGLMGKQSMHEHSLRVPLILSGPGIARGKSETKPTYLWELYGKLCNASQLSTPSSIDKPNTVAPYFGYRDFQRAVCIGDRKMIWYRNTKETVRLQYDLAADPYEERNLFATSRAWPEGDFLAAARQAQDLYGDDTSTIEGLSTRR